jgi:hypothetical protein
MRLQLTRSPLDILLQTAVCLALAQISSPSRAEAFSAIESKPISELWLNPGLISYHLKHDDKRNDDNYGIGVEYRYSTVHAVTLGVFNNSFRETSRYVGWLWQPVGLGPVRIGAAVGAINGYSEHRNGAWFPAVIPTASIEYNYIGASLMLVPPAVKGTGAISLQLRLKAF